jgi:tetratricopeptide (TPR) repeat protein
MGGEANGHRVEPLLESALAHKVELGPAYVLRGMLRLQGGRLMLALADAERAVALAPAEAGGYYVRGRVRLEREQDGALADLTRAAELSSGSMESAVPGRAQALHWLAEALFRGGKADEALRYARQAVQLQPGNPELAEQLKQLEKAARPAPAGP